MSHARRCASSRHEQTADRFEAQAAWRPASEIGPYKIADGFLDGSLPSRSFLAEEAKPFAEQKFRHIAKTEKLSHETFVVRTKDEEKVRRDLNTATLK